MGRLEFVLRAGLWLTFLVAALTLPLVYLLRAPIPVGIPKVAAAGAAVGIAIGLVVQFFYWPVVKAGGAIRRAKYLAGISTLGAFGGAGGAALIDEQKVVETGLVELPLVRVEQVGRRLRRNRTQIVTLEPVNPTHETRITVPGLSQVAAKSLWPGMCLEARLERGRFGGTWIAELAATSCSHDRGKPSTHVIVLDQFAGWRWHTPHFVGQRGDAHFSDDSLPLGLSCLTRPDHWLYRCSRASGAPATAQQRENKRSSVEIDLMVAVREPPRVSCCSGNGFPAMHNGHLLR
jgi:hypothetical protein